MQILLSGFPSDLANPLIALVKLSGWVVDNEGDTGDTHPIGVNSAFQAQDLHRLPIHISHTYVYYVIVRTSHPEGYL